MDENFCPTCLYFGHDNTAQTIHKQGEVCPKLLTIQLQDIVDTVSERVREKK
tara:strand:+ start:7107 stop:7262 length:156 start_codon:yes stop_codon:yes gene_type:complete